MDIIPSFKMEEDQFLGVIIVRNQFTLDYEDYVVEHPDNVGVSVHVNQEKIASSGQVVICSEKIWKGEDVDLVTWHRIWSLGPY